MYLNIYRVFKKKLFNIYIIDQCSELVAYFSPISEAQPIPTAHSSMAEPMIARDAQERHDTRNMLESYLLVNYH